MKNILKLVSNFVFRPKTIARTVNNKVVVLDFASMKDSKFEGCTVVYYGFGGLDMGHCIFTNCTIVFAGPAKNAIDLNNAFAIRGWGSLVETYASNEVVNP